MTQTIKKALLLALLVTACTLSTANAQLNDVFGGAGGNAQTQLVGDWHEIRNRDEGTFEVGYRFMANGDLVLANAKKDRNGNTIDTNRWEGRYSVNGSKIHINYDDGDVEDFTFSISRNVLDLKVDGSTCFSLSRAGQSSEAPAAQDRPASNFVEEVQGTWCRMYSYEDGSSMEIGYRFDSNGRMRLVIIETPVKGESETSSWEGNYSIRGDHVTLNFDDGDVLEYDYSILDGSLVLSRDGEIAYVLPRPY